MSTPPRRAGRDLVALARLYVDIAVWRRGPQDVPAVGILLPLTIAAYVLITAVLGVLLPPMRPGWLPQLGLDVPFTALWYWLVLAIARRRERYRQTATALFALQATLALPSVVSVWLLGRFTSPGIWQTLADVIAFAIMVWALVAIGHILRAALERPLAFCLILAFMQLLAEELLFLAVFGAAPGGTVTP